MCQLLPLFIGHMCLVKPNIILLTSRQALKHHRPELCFSCATDQWGAVFRPSPPVGKPRGPMAAAGGLRRSADPEPCGVRVQQTGWLRCLLKGGETRSAQIWRLENDGDANGADDARCACAQKHPLHLPPARHVTSRALIRLPTSDAVGRARHSPAGGRRERVASTRGSGSCAQLVNKVWPHGGERDANWIKRQHKQQEQEEEAGDQPSPLLAPSDVPLLAERGKSVCS